MIRSTLLIKLAFMGSLRFLTQNLKKKKTHLKFNLIYTILMQEYTLNTHLWLSYHSCFSPKNHSLCVLLESEPN